MNKQKMLERYQAKMHKMIKDKLEGKLDLQWNDIAKKLGCTTASLRCNRHKFFPEYDTWKILDPKFVKQLKWRKKQMINLQSDRK